MINSILKAIVIGILAGTTIFFMPKFLVSAIILLIVIKLLFGRGRRHMYHHRFGRHRFGDHRFAFADKIRSMNDDEYSEFKNQFGNRDCNNFGRNRTDN